MRILVTGGAAFIGSHYVRTLLGSPADVQITVLDNLTYAGNMANLAVVADDPALTFVHGDICDARLVDRLVAENEQIVHFAAESHVDRSITGGADFVRTNVLGTHTLLDAAVRHDNGSLLFLSVSTDEVYGSIAHGSWPETHPLSPSSPYSASKAAADLLGLAAHHTHRLDVRITRCANNCGPYQHPEKFIPRFVTLFLQNRAAPLYGDGRQVREWLHVDDHVRALELVRAKGAPGEIYNVGAGRELSNLAVAEALRLGCGVSPDLIRFVADRKGHDRRYSVDTTKISNELGFLPERDFESGLRETIGWYRENREWWSAASRAAHAPGPAILGSRYQLR